MKTGIVPIVTLLALATFAFAALAPVTVSAQQGAGTPNDPVAGAAEAQRWCGSCHAVEGRNTASDTAPPFNTIAHDPKMTPENLRTFLANPHKPMPPLTLSRPEIENLVAYFGALKSR